MLLGVELGHGNKGSNSRLLRPRERRLLGRIFDRSGYTFTIPERDHYGLKALGEMDDRAVKLVADVLALLSFFVMIRVEVGFDVACVDLSERLADKWAITTFPLATARREVELSARVLYDVSLARTVDRPVVGNDADADGKSLVVITGANQGGGRPSCAVSA